MVEVTILTLKLKRKTHTVKDHQGRGGREESPLPLVKQEELLHLTCLNFLNLWAIFFLKKTTCYSNPFFTSILFKVQIFIYAVVIKIV